MVVNAKADVANITERLVADAIAMQCKALH